MSSTPQTRFVRGQSTHAMNVMEIAFQHRLEKHQARDFRETGVSRPRRLSEQEARRLHLAKLAATILHRPEVGVTDLDGPDAPAVAAIVETVTGLLGEDSLRTFRYNAPLAARVVEMAMRIMSEKPTGEPQQGDPQQGDQQDGDGDQQDGDGDQQGDQQDREAEALAEALAANQPMLRDMAEIASTMPEQAEVGAGAGHGDLTKSKVQRLSQDVQQSIVDFLEDPHVSASVEQAAAFLGEARKMLGAMSRMHAEDGAATVGFKQSSVLHDILPRELASMGMGPGFRALGAKRLVSGEMLAPDRKHYSPSGSGDFLILVDRSGSMDFRPAGTTFSQLQFSLLLALATAYEAMDQGRHVKIAVYDDHMDTFPLTGNTLVDVNRAMRSGSAGGTNLFGVLYRLMNGEDASRWGSGMTLDRLGFSDLPDLLILTDGDEPIKSPVIYDQVSGWFQDRQVTTLHMLHRKANTYRRHRGVVEQSDLDTGKAGGADWQKLADMVVAGLPQPGWCEPDLVEAYRKSVLRQDGRFSSGSIWISHGNSRVGKPVPVLYWSLLAYTDWCGVVTGDLREAVTAIGRAFGG